MRLNASFLFFALVTALLVPISASAQTDAFCTAVYDANGDRVGKAVQNATVTTLLLQQDGRVIRLYASGSVVNGRTPVYFTETNCAGDAYMESPGLAPEAHLVRLSTTIWYPDTLVPDVPQITPASVRDKDGVCTDSSEIVGGVSPALSMTFPIYASPHHLEAEACYTPSPAVAALTPYSLGAMALVLAFGAYLNMRRQRVS
jgi:hypothetical protein